MAEVDATPGAVEMAEEEELDLAVVEGSGANGRITLSDVREAVKARDNVVETELCGHENVDYRPAGYEKGDLQFEAKLLCEKLKGHRGEHYAAKDTKGNKVTNGYWNSRVGQEVRPGPTQFPETLPPGYAERMVPD